MIGLFGSVWGIGPVTAQKLYEKGHRSLEDLKTDESLTQAQRTGLKFHFDIIKKIPRHEVSLYFDKIFELKYLFLEWEFIFSICYYFLHGHIATFTITCKVLHFMVVLQYFFNSMPFKIFLR